MLSREQKQQFNKNIFCILYSCYEIHVNIKKNDFVKNKITESSFLKQTVKKSSLETTSCTEYYNYNTF